MTTSASGACSASPAASLLSAALPTKTPASLSAATARSIAAKGSRGLSPRPCSGSRQPADVLPDKGALPVSCSLHPSARQPALPCRPPQVPLAPSPWHYRPLQCLLPCSGEQEPRGRWLYPSKGAPQPTPQGSCSPLRGLLPRCCLSLPSPASALPAQGAGGALGSSPALLPCPPEPHY